VQDFLGSYYLTIFWRYGGGIFSGKNEFCGKMAVQTVKRAPENISG
jgi:hypothetical protein